jgi:hypothetical protein
MKRTGEMKRRRYWAMRKFKGWEDGLLVKGIFDLLDLLRWIGLLGAVTTMSG